MEREADLIEVDVIWAYIDPDRETRTDGVDDDGSGPRVEYEFKFGRRG